MNCLGCVNEGGGSSDNQIATADVPELTHTMPRLYLTNRWHHRQRQISFADQRVPHCAFEIEARKACGTRRGQCCKYAPPGCPLIIHAQWTDATYTTDCSQLDVEM